MPNVLDDIATSRLKQFCHLRLCQPDRLIYEMNVNFGASAFRLINDNVALILIGDKMFFISHTHTSRFLKTFP